MAQRGRRQKALTPQEVEEHSFSPARRGFDVEEVRAFLGDVAADLREAADRERTLAREVERLEARLRSQASVSAPSPEGHRSGSSGAVELDEASLTAALGAEAASILRSAHQAADEIKARAEEQAAKLVRDATD